MLKQIFLSNLRCDGEKSERSDLPSKGQVTIWRLVSGDRCHENSDHQMYPGVPCPRGRRNGGGRWGVFPDPARQHHVHAPLHSGIFQTLGLRKSSITRCWDLIVSIVLLYVLLWHYVTHTLKKGFVGQNRVAGHWGLMLPSLIQIVLKENLPPHQYCNCNCSAHPIDLWSSLNVWQCRWNLKASWQRWVGGLYSQFFPDLEEKVWEWYF